MKILLTLASLDIGGAETHVTELAAELHRRGHNVIVASNGGVYADELESMGIKHFVVPLARRNIPDMIASRKILKQIILKEKPDIVHAHARIPAFIVSTLTKSCNFVFVTTVHGAFDTSFVLRHLSGWGDKTLAVSLDLKNYLLENYNVNPDNVYTSINGISSKKFSKNTDSSRIMKEFGLSDNDNRICYVSRLSDGICSCAYMLLDEFERMNENIEKLQLIIVGDGEHFDTLKEKADSINSRLGRDAVILTGGRTDVNEILATAKVCVGVSRAILEPMSMEKLCIVAGDPGYIGIMDESKLSTAIDCNFTCRGCDPVDSGVMADDIIKLFSLPETEADKLRTFAGDVVSTHYSIDKMVSDNEKMYEDAMREFGHDAAILGYYGYGNCGDDALLHAILGDINALRPFFSPTVLSFNPVKTTAEYGVRSINRFNISKVKKVFKKVRLFIAGGGSLIQDVTSTKSILYYLYIIRLAKKRGVPVMLYGNGIGPVTRPFNRRLASKILNLTDVITLRDPDSLELLKEINVTKPLIKITADPALSLDWGNKETAVSILKKYGLKEDEKFFCLSVRRWKNMGDAAASFAGICDYVSEKYGLTPVIVPMQYTRDMPVGKEIADLVKCRCISIDQPLSAEEILSILLLSEASVAVRLHMLIFGTLVGVPVLGVDYDPKVSSFNKFAGINHCLTTDNLATGTYLPVVEDFFENREQIAASLKSKLGTFKEDARENAKIAVELIENER